MGELYWHCLDCGNHEAVDPKTPEYTLGDWEKCECGGAAHVVTLRTGAAYEQGRALGLAKRDAWERAQSIGQRDAASATKGGDNG